MRTILVTGGAGYIGSHVVKELLHQNHRPIVFDNLQTGHRKAAKNALFIEGDLSDQRKLAETFQTNSIDAVMHFAADCLVGESVQDPVKYFNNNVKNGLKIIEMMEEFNVKKLFFLPLLRFMENLKKSLFPRNIPVLQQILMVKPSGSMKRCSRRFIMQGN